MSLPSTLDLALPRCSNPYHIHIISRPMRHEGDHMPRVVPEDDAEVGEDARDGKADGKGSPNGEH